MAQGEGMKYNVSVQPYGNGKIEGKVYPTREHWEDPASPMECVTRWIIDTLDEQTRAALIKLGWHAPGEIAAIDVPILPTVSVGHFPPKYRRVTADDVARMEAELADLRMAVAGIRSITKRLPL